MLGRLSVIVNLDFHSRFPDYVFSQKYTPASMVKCLSLLVILLLTPISGRAQSVDWIQVHNLTIRGLNRLYSLDVQDAMRSFDSVSRIAPGDPRGPFFKSMVHFYIYTLNRDENEREAFLEESENVINVGESLLERNDRDATTKFYLGGIHGYRGLVFQMSGSILKAARDGRKGYLLLEDAVNENPALYDAHMGFGLFRYWVAKIPKSMRWILNVLGFEGDLEGGLQSLKLAAERGTYTRTEAKLFLAQFLFSEGRQDTALQYLRELRQEYPENTLFLVLYASWQHRLHNLDEAITAARSAMDLNKRKTIHYGEELVYSTLGSIYFTLNDFVNARTYYRLYMLMTKNDERTPNYTFYRAAVACEIAGDRNSAVEFCQRMREVTDKERMWDASNYRRGQELLRQPLTESDILIVKGGNEASLKKFARAIELYNDAFQKAGASADLQIRALYGIQQAQFDDQNFLSAVETSNRLLALKPVRESWIIPHGWFKLGQSYSKMGRTSDARNAFGKVGNFDAYDHQTNLEERTKEELKKLERNN